MEQSRGNLLGTHTCSWMSAPSLITGIPEPQGEGRSLCCPHSTSYQPLSHSSLQMELIAFPWLVMRGTWVHPLLHGKGVSVSEAALHVLLLSCPELPSRLGSLLGPVSRWFSELPGCTSLSESLSAFPCSLGPALDSFLLTLALPTLGDQLAVKIISRLYECL